MCGVGRYRRLRRLVPDGDLVRRRAAGETLRELAADYGVTHSTLGRWFARPEIAKQLKEARRLVRRERQAAAARQAAERRWEGEVRKRAKRQAALERERRLSSARALVEAARPGARRRRRSAYEGWLDQHDAWQPPTRADLRSGNDEVAASTVAAGGGVPAVIEATGLRTRANVLRLIDPVLLVRAFDNDAAARAVAEPPRDRLRRLRPDPELVRRRAAGETLRRIAADYEVAHTTLYRYFQRPQVARQLSEARRRRQAQKIA
jgi:uncharacterized protein (DUF433 family)